MEDALSFLLKKADSLADFERLPFSLANSGGETENYCFRFFVLDWEVYSWFCEVYCFYFHRFRITDQTPHNLRSQVHLHLNLFESPGVTNKISD